MIFFAANCKYIIYESFVGVRKCCVGVYAVRWKQLDAYVTHRRIIKVRKWLMICYIWCASTSVYRQTLSVKLAIKGKGDALGGLKIMRCAIEVVSILSACF